MYLFTENDDLVNKTTKGHDPVEKDLSFKY